MIEPKIENLLDKVDNHYTLVVLAARRARQVVDYYTKLGAGLEEKPLPPLLDSVHGFDERGMKERRMKPLTISLHEIEQEKIGFERQPASEESVK